MSQLMGILLKEWFLSSSMMLLQKPQKTSVHCVQEKTWGGGPFMRHVCALMSSTVHVGVCYGHFVGWVCQEARPGSTAQKGENGIGPKLGKPLHYKGTFFHHIAKGFMAQGGDLLRQAGCAGESIYGDNFPDELPKLKHNEPGLLSMSISDRDLCGSIFILTFRANKDLDRKNVVFGKLAQGYDVLKKIENAGDEEGRPEVTVKIVNCGEYGERDKKKLVKLMARKDAFSEVKHKRSKRRRKRRRKYYTSDSNSSSDSDIDTTDSDSDSDLDSSSTSLVSSSSDDRRRKRKRSSKRDKHKQGKKRDRRRERKRRKHDKRLKRRSRRSSDSITETESESSDGSSDDGAKARGSVLKHKADLKVTAGNYSPLVEDNAAASHHTRGRGDEKLSGKDHRSPKENGKQQSNGFERDARSDRSEDRQPDVVDDHPGKSRSRSRSVSPKRPPSKSMSGSPKRSISQSCSVSPKRPVSRSSSASRSLQSPIIPKSRSISRSPKGSRGSRSPVRRSISRSPAGRSISRSPQRLGPQRSISGSPPKSLPRRSPSRSLPKTSSRRSVGRSPIAASRSPCRRSSHRSISRSSGRVPSRRVASRSPIRSPRRGRRRSYSRSRSPVRRVRSPPSVRRRSLSRSASPDVSPKRVRRGRGFSDRYSYARRYRTPSPSPRPYRYGGRSGRYSSYRRYSPPPRRRISRSPPRYRSRRSPSVSRSPPYHRRRYSPSPVRSLSRSPTRSCSPVDRYRAPCDDKRRSFSSRSRSPTRSPRDSPPPKRGSKDGSISSSSSGSPPAKALVSYGDGSPDSSGR